MSQLVASICHTKNRFRIGPTTPRFRDGKVGLFCVWPIASSRAVVFDSTKGSRARMRTSIQGLKLIEEFEGFRPALYNDAAGNCTIGFGCLVHAGPLDGQDPRERPFANGISRADAERLLAAHVGEVERSLERLVKVPLTPGEFDALVDFVYNVGVGDFARSTLLNKLNAGDYSAVPGELLKFVHAGGRESAGLARRRAREVELWQSASPVEQASGTPVHAAS
jgi:lysozyme